MNDETLAGNEMVACQKGLKNACQERLLYNAMAGNELQQERLLGTISDETPVGNDQ